MPRPPHFLVTAQELKAAPQKQRPPEAPATYKEPTQLLEKATWKGLQCSNWPAGMRALHRYSASSLPRLRTMCRGFLAVRKATSSLLKAKNNRKHRGRFCGPAAL